MTLTEGLQLILQAVYMVAFMYGIVHLFEAAWQLKNAQVAECLNRITAVLLLAMGPTLIRVFFTLFGLPGGFDI
jgi:hypothetical protein